MRLALLSDIHANREAFAAVLSDLEGRAIDRIVLLGDIVGYGPDPAWCVDKATELVQTGAWCLRGNHDNAIAQAEAMNPVAKAAIDWTRPRLSDAQKAFLSALPLTLTLDDILFVHASANDPGSWSYVSSHNKAIPSFEASEARLIFCGHVHVPALMSRDLGGVVRQQDIHMGTPLPLLRSRRWLAVIGSVGQPRDGVAQAGYAILDTAKNELTFRRAPYDQTRTVSKLREAGLPEALATRLLQGT